MTDRVRINAYAKKSALNIMAHEARKMIMPREAVKSSL
jgi:hypothetical protein